MTVIPFITRAYEDFAPIITALEAELGPRFPVSMQNWCGIGTRPYPLLDWNVFLGKDAITGEIVGVYSYYQQTNDPPDRFWIGWIGVVSGKRRQGYASEFLDKIKEDAVALGARELWVHTEAENLGAISFYKNCGMNLWGEFKNLHLEQASVDDNSVVLRMAPILFR